MLSIKIILPNINNITVFAVYRRPSYNKQLLFDILYNSFNSYNFSNNNIILCGDFNINFMDSLDSQPFFNILNQLDLFYVIHTPTRFSTSTASLIDNFCIDKNMMCTGTLCSDITDQLPLYINLNLNIIENDIYISKRNISPQCINNCISDLEKCDWDLVTSLSNINSIYYIYIYDTFI